jgi:hypothetical protein
LRKPLGFRDYKDLLVSSCAAEVRRLAIDTTLSDDDIADRLLADKSPLQERAYQLGVKLVEFNVSYCNPRDSELVEPVQLPNGSDNQPKLTAVDMVPAA